MLHNNKNVFIVDDDEAVRESLSVVLQTAGYQVRAWASGTEFLAAIDGHGAGCVLLDTLMPQQNGLDTLRHIRAARPDLPVIMMAGGDGIASPEDAIGAGAMDYLAKPFLEDALYERIEKAFLLADIQDGRSPSAEDANHGRQMLDRLSATEREIFDMLVIERSDASIAASLDLDTLDVCIHRDAIMEKLEARNVVQLMHVAFLCGIPIMGAASRESPRRPAGNSRQAAGAPPGETRRPRYRFPDERKKR